MQGFDLLQDRNTILEFLVDFSLQYSTYIEVNNVLFLCHIIILVRFPYGVTNA
jgi:hypothetical protein